MTGNNKIELNEASMIEAVQLLLDRDAPGVGKVTSVKPHPNGGYASSADGFDVTITKDAPST